MDWCYVWIEELDKSLDTTLLIRTLHVSTILLEEKILSNDIGWKL